jgi:hypothetical protein
MKALSLHQPWATLMAMGVKQVETRSWSTKYRGPLLIHAANKWSPEQDRVAREYRHVLAGTLMEFGGIIGIVNLTEIVDAASTSLWINPWIQRRIVIDGALRIPRSEYALGIYNASRFAWLTTGARTLPIHRVRGYQGLFNVDNCTGADWQPALRSAD